MCCRRASSTKCFVGDTPQLGIGIYFDGRRRTDRPTDRDETVATQKTNSYIQIWNLFVDRHRDSFCIFRFCHRRAFCQLTGGDNNILLLRLLLLLTQPQPVSGGSRSSFITTYKQQTRRVAIGCRVFVVLADRALLHNNILHPEYSSCLGNDDDDDDMRFDERRWFR